MPKMVASVYRKHDSFHNGRDWTYLAKVALNNDIELYRYNQDYPIVRKLLNRTFKLYEDSVEYQIRVKKGINKQILQDLKLYIRSKIETGDLIGALMKFSKWLFVDVKIRLKKLI